MSSVTASIITEEQEIQRVKTKLLPTYTEEIDFFISIYDTQPIGACIITKESSNAYGTPKTYLLVKSYYIMPKYNHELTYNNLVRRLLQLAVIYDTCLIAPSLLFTEDKDIGLFKKLHGSSVIIIYEPLTALNRYFSTNLELAIKDIHPSSNRASKL